MERLIPIIAIIFVLFQVFGRSKKVKNARPGQQQAAKPAAGSPAAQPRRSAPYQPPRTAPARPAATPTRPTAAPARSTPVPQPAKPQVTYTGGMLDESDRARTDLAEGESRECNHGSIGGSMDITSHMGEGPDYQHAEPHGETSGAGKTQAAAASGASASLQSITKLTAAQMRQAVIMSEILKRPTERWQRGRWAAR